MVRSLWCRGLHEKLIVTQLVKILPIFYDTGRFTPIVQSVAQRYTNWAITALCVCVCVCVYIHAKMLVGFIYLGIHKNIKKHLKLLLWLWNQEAEHVEWLWTQEKLIYIAWDPRRRCTSSMPLKWISVNGVCMRNGLNWLRIWFSFGLSRIEATKQNYNFVVYSTFKLI